MMLVKAFVVYFDILETPSFMRPGVNESSVSEEPFSFNGGILMNGSHILKLLFFFFACLLIGRVV